MWVLYIPGGFFGGFLNHPTVAPAKDGWKMILSFWGTAHFQGQLFVLGRVYSLSGSGETMDSTFESKKVRQIDRFFSIHHALEYTRVHVYTTCKLNKIIQNLCIYCISWSSICLLLFIYWGMSWQNYAQWLLDAFIFGRHEQECLQPTHINRHFSWTSWLRQTSRPNMKTTWLSSSKIPISNLSQSTPCDFESKRKRLKLSTLKSHHSYQHHQPPTIYTP